jgi:hypothetical protein
VKKLFLVFLVLLAGVAGLSAAPLRPGGGNDAPLMVMPQEDMAVSIAASGIPVLMQPGGVFSMVQESAFTRDLELICLWADQYREGLLTREEFETLVAGRIRYLFSMFPVQDKCRNLSTTLQRIGSLAPAGYPLLC